MRFPLVLSGPTLGLILLVGCASTQADPAVATVAPPPEIVAPAPDQKVAPASKPDAPASETAETAPASEVAPPAKELTLLEIFPVQPVTRAEKPGQSKPRVDNAGNLVLTEPPSEALIAEKTAAGEVWVNASSGAFHKPGTQYYGKTKKGFFLPEDEAIKQGFRGVKGQ